MVLCYAIRNTCVVFFTHHFRPYLAGHHFTLRTDHGSLSWLRKFKEPKGQLAQWLERLQEFNFDVVHQWGRKHTNADALSRWSCTKCGQENHSTAPALVAVTGILPSEHRSLDELQQLQLADATMGLTLQSKEASQKPTPDKVKTLSPASRHLFQLWDQLLVKDGLLW